jgi:glycosyltransferase involved in cell wall biosynthesis
MINHHRRSKVNCVNRSLAMARYLVQRGHQVTLLTTADHRKVGVVEDWEDGVHIVEIPDLLWGQLRSGWDPWSALNRILYLLRCEKEFDLIHLFESRPAVIHPIQVYRMQRRLPLIIDWVDGIGRGGILEVRRPGWYRLLFGRMETFYEEHFRAGAEGVTVICTALGERAQALGIARDAILHIPVGTDLDTYPAVLDKNACRAAIGLSQESKFLAFAGIDADFDLPLVFSAFARVVEKWPETRLMLIGKSNQAMLNAAREYGIAEWVISAGYVPYNRFPTYLGCADIFLLPFPGTVYNVSRWPSKICDYMASGRPTISNPTGDIKSLFEKHKVGILANESAEAFAAKIVYLFEHPDAAILLGQNARHIAETHYAWPNLIKGLESFYSHILERVGKQN